MLILEIGTPHGTARVHLRQVPDPIGALVLGHGAGGGIESPDLTAAVRAAHGAGASAVLVEQPYRVAGRRSPSPAGQLDVAWLAVIDALREKQLRDVPLVVGGRSSGARVACRTADGTGAVAALCLAFPLHPPGKAGDPSKSRLAELDAVRVPVLVVQGENDPFGMPPPASRRQVVRVRGNHSLSSDVVALRTAVGEWLAQVG